MKGRARERNGVVDSFSMIFLTFAGYLKEGWRAEEMKGRAR